MTPVVSVLMSCWNALPWLDEAVASVLRQSLGDLELILVNDGSGDGTGARIDHWATVDGRVVAIHKANSGLQDSLNVGLARARGQWIARLDADDIAEPERLARQLAFVQSHPDTVLVGSGCVVIDPEGVPGKSYAYAPGHEALVAAMEGMGAMVPHSSAFFRTETARALGGYRIRFRQAEDWDLWLRLSAQGRIASLPEPLIRLRKHDTNMSHEKGGRVQLTNAVAAVVCHLRRKSGRPDPYDDAAGWPAFLQAVETTLERLGAFRRFQDAEALRRAWRQPGPLPLRVGRLAVAIVKRPSALSLLRERLSGNDLAQQVDRLTQTTKKGRSEA